MVSSIKKSSNTSLGEYEPAIDLLTDLAPVNLPLPREHYVVAPIDLLDSKYWLFFFDFGEIVLAFAVGPGGLLGWARLGLHRRPLGSCTTL